MSTPSLPRLAPPGKRGMDFPLVPKRRHDRGNQPPDACSPLVSDNLMRFLCNIFARAYPGPFRLSTGSTFGERAIPELYRQGPFEIFPHVHGNMDYLAFPIALPKSPLPCALCRLAWWATV